MVSFIVSVAILAAVLAVCGRWYTRKERALRAEANEGDWDARVDRQRA
jgi:hypothetical protein